MRTRCDVEMLVITVYLIKVLPVFWIVEAQFVNSNCKKQIEWKFRKAFTGVCKATETPSLKWFCPIPVSSANVRAFNLDRKPTLSKANLGIGNTFFCPNISMTTQRYPDL